jgi:surfeit locus 1 family protein
MSPPRTGGRRFLFFGAAVVGFIVFVALGAWQVQRLGWKRDLIARVDARLQAPPTEGPGVARFDPLEHEYRRVTLRGRFLNDRETLVQATTKLGGGYWVLTPFVTDHGLTVLVNRGFVDTSRRDARDWTRIDGPTMVRGLVRVSEPGGGFLRDNRSADDRWYSRDVDAIARARELGRVAPYFVDADAAESLVPGAPTGGLTVVRFRNNHLQYALTWFTLAALLAVAAIRAYLQERSITRAARE